MGTDTVVVSRFLDSRESSSSPNSGRSYSSRQTSTISLYIDDISSEGWITRASRSKTRFISVGTQRARHMRCRNSASKSGTRDTEAERNERTNAGKDEERKRASRRIWFTALSTSQRKSRFPQLSPCCGRRVWAAHAAHCSRRGTSVAMIMNERNDHYYRRGYIIWCNICTHTPAFRCMRAELRVCIVIRWIYYILLGFPPDFQLFPFICRAI